ncbi:MAG: hypothetical protein IT319_09415 [Anaerolineae bacterium]|nr:hypothetical protein [Anaerolineae bacterium]
MKDAALLALLIARWEALAEQARQQMRADSVNDISRVAYYEGVFKTYRTAAGDLRELIAPAEAPEAAAAEEPREYRIVPEAEVAAILRRAGLFARSLTLHPDHVYTAVFPRLQPVTHEARLRQLSSADPRIIIVEHGTLRDSGDLFIDFAFS